MAKPIGLNAKLDSGNMVSGMVMKFGGRSVLESSQTEPSGTRYSRESPGEYCRKLYWLEPTSHKAVNSFVAIEPYMAHLSGLAHAKGRCTHIIGPIKASRGSNRSYTLVLQYADSIFL